MKIRSFILRTLACFALIGIIAPFWVSRLPITIRARIAEDGGFMPNAIKARVEEPLRLRLVSDDVEHTFVVGQNILDPVLLQPGKPVYLTLTFDKPGIYTFYSTSPSSMNFWRMRGTIEVLGNETIQTVEPPLYVRLGLNLDEEHQSSEESVQLTRLTSAARGAVFANQIAHSYLTPDYYVAHSPMESYKNLRAESALQSLSDEEIWDIVAYIWLQNSTSTALLEGRRLYQVNCAACHGENGAGDGQFADEMKAIAEQNQDKHGIQPPTDFTDAEHLF